MADATTPRGYTQPEVGGSVDTWGSKLNANWGLVDTDVTWNESAIGDDYDVGADGTIKDRLDVIEPALDATVIVADGALQRDGGAMTGRLDEFTGTIVFEDIGTVGPGTEDLDLDLANYFRVDLADDVTFTFSNVPSVSGSLTVLIIDVTGGAGNTITWPAEVTEWYDGGSVPTPNAHDVYALITIDGGTNWQASIMQEDLQ